MDTLSKGKSRGGKGPHGPVSEAWGYLPSNGMGILTRSTELRIQAGALECRDPLEVIDREVHSRLRLEEGLNGPRSFFETL